jgi:hypothetical protein
MRLEFVIGYALMLMVIWIIFIRRNKNDEM